ncbi:MAG: flagellar assembly protein FliW [Anaerolineae bacterium]
MQKSDGTASEIVFVEGLIGCEDWKRFVLLECGEPGPVELLQSLDDPDIGFLVANPYEIVDGYRLDVAAADREAIELGHWDDALVLCTLIVRQDPMEVTANLLGPLVINRANGRGVQVVLSGSEYSTRQVIASVSSEGP